MSTAAPPAMAAPAPARSAKYYYLLTFNALSALAWLVVLFRVVLSVYILGFGGVHGEVDVFWRTTQSVAALEVAHAVFGIVRAPVLTTVMQVASRFLLAWGIVYPFPELASSPAFTTMLLAHAVTEVVRYRFFTLALSGQDAGVVGWLRYNMFYVLYPMGISSECWLVYRAIGPASAIAPAWGWVLYAILAVYVPGSYVLFTHMMKQRAKVMKGKGVEKKTQ